MFGLIPFTNHSTNKLGEDFRDFLSDFFNDDFFAPMSITNGMDKFSAKTRETDNEYLVCAKLPGVKKEDISLDYDNNNLIIRAKCEENHDQNDNGFNGKFKSVSEFSRSFYLDNVNRDKIRAKFEDGELKIILPKQMPSKSSQSSIFIE